MMIRKILPTLPASIQANSLQVELFIEGSNKVELKLRLDLLPNPTVNDQYIRYLSCLSVSINDQRNGKKVTLSYQQNSNPI